MNENLPQNQFRDVRKTRIINWVYKDGHSAESEVNEALELGWELLTIQQGSETPIFVLGWTAETESQLTCYQKRIASYNLKAL